MQLAEKGATPFEPVDEVGHLLDVAERSADVLVVLVLRRCELLQLLQQQNVSVKRPRVRVSTCW